MDEPIGIANRLFGGGTDRAVERAHPMAHQSSNTAQDTSLRPTQNPYGAPRGHAPSPSATPRFMPPNMFSRPSGSPRRVPSISSPYARPIDDTPFMVLQNDAPPPPQPPPAAAARATGQPQFGPPPRMRSSLPPSSATRPPPHRVRDDRKVYVKLLASPEVQLAVPREVSTVTELRNFVLSELVFELSQYETSPYGREHGGGLMPIRSVENLNRSGSESLLLTVRKREPYYSTTASNAIANGGPMGASGPVGSSRHPGAPANDPDADISIVEDVSPRYVPISPPETATAAEVPRYQPPRQLPPDAAHQVESAHPHATAVPSRFAVIPPPGSSAVDEMTRMPQKTPDNESWCAFRSGGGAEGQWQLGYIKSMAAQFTKIHAYDGERIAPHEFPEISSSTQVVIVNKATDSTEAASLVPDAKVLVKGERGTVRPATVQKVTSTGNVLVTFDSETKSESESVRGESDSNSDSDCEIQQDFHPCKIFCIKRPLPVKLPQTTATLKDRITGLYGLLGQDPSNMAHAIIAAEEAQVYSSRDRPVGTEHNYTTMAGRLEEQRVRNQKRREEEERKDRAHASHRGYKRQR